MISFGLVSIPVKLFTTQKTGSALSFHLLHDACGTRLRQQYVCPKHGEVVSREHIAKGYEFARDQHVMLSEAELEALEAVSDNAIALSEFVPAEAVDPLYFEKAYYLGPDRGGERAYRLLGHAMRQTGLVGVARYAARGKQYVVLVRPYGLDGLIMHQLRYQDEVGSFAEVPVDTSSDVGEAELDLAVRIIEHIATDTFDPAQYEDQVKERVLDLIQQKIAGQDIAAVPQPPRGELVDLMEALKASLGLAAAEELPAGARQRKPPKPAQAPRSKPAEGRRKAAKLP